ncbi:Plasmodium exported protein (PHISTa), unknown function [Plasmodium reichenowi]|uniref:Plasmodium RESA N-terminal domain-containing protein n=1 Tax=Plasmodium reichenowi TaxID=5854 RepID=A0A2P9DCI4_PLARE|nr:Plasmodium exported protein (PHISTa), unknown function [Plasmodium reichenowi]
MTNKKNCSFFAFYSADENQKGKLNYISLKFLCLTLYMIGFCYVFLYNSFESVSLEIYKNCNIYQRNLVEEKRNKTSYKKKYLKNKKEDIDKTEGNVNDLKCNELCLEENKHSINNDLGKSNKENESNISTCDINYNDVSKNLTETELREVLNSFKECPPKEDLRNIWNHTIGVAKEGFYNVQKDLKGSIQKYLDNDIDSGIYERGNKIYLYASMWHECISEFHKTVATEELEYSKKFFSLINGKHTLDDILNFIYSFLEHIEILKNELHGKYQKKLSQKISQISNERK